MPDAAFSLKNSPKNTEEAVIVSALVRDGRRRWFLSGIAKPRKKEFSFPCERDGRIAVIITKYRTSVRAGTVAVARSVSLVRDEDKHVR